MKMVKTARLMLPVLLAGSMACHEVDRAASRFLDGCTDSSRETFLAEASLHESTGVSMTLGPIQLTPPAGSVLSRAQEEISISRGVYCDSGDWGVDPDTQIQIKLYQGAVPATVDADPPAQQRGRLRSAIPSVGTVPFSFEMNGLEWSARTQLRGPFGMAVRSVYLTAPVGGSDPARTVAVSFFSLGGPESVSAQLLPVLGSIRLAADSP